MKKGATKTSGILTLLMYIILLVFAVFTLGMMLEIEALANIVSEGMIEKLYYLVSTIFCGVPVTLINKFVPSLDTDLISKVIAGVFTAFSAYMIFWGIKEITLTKKDDVNFARCKKTCGFMMFIKFMVFLYLLAVIACSFVIDEIKILSAALDLVFEIQYIFVIVTAVFAVLAFLTFLLPVINFSKAAKAVGEGGGVDPNAQGDPNMYNNGQGQYQPTMQANMPPMPGYQPQTNGAPVQAQFNPQVQAAEEEKASTIQPGQNGVPANITQKGIEDLERLERLRASGSITEENYNVMRQKICDTNIE